MPTSQNGYSANDRSVITTYTVGDGRKVALRKGSTGAMLKHLADWFDRNIRDLDAGIMDDWGYAERPIRGGTELSNHASGTAIDINATHWILGSDPAVYLSAAEIAKLRDHLHLYKGCIRWGGDYTGRRDPMHFEINRDQATVDSVWDWMSNAPEEDDLPYTEAQLRKIISEELDKKLDTPQRMDVAWQRARQIIDKFSVKPRTDSVVDALDGDPPPA